MNYLKDEYIELRKEAMKKGVPNTCYTGQMIFKLRDMAEKDVYPDGNFSDEECNIWSAFHIPYSVLGGTK